MIGTTLMAVAAFVDDNASATAWDPHQRLTDEQRFAKGERIKAVADELRTLADASETRKVRYGEYEALKDRLYAFGFVLLPTLTQNVAMAFHDAEGPIPPREKGWLRGPGAL